jgi:uncharacterized membrane protein (UPF0127 family)
MTSFSHSLSAALAALVVLALTGVSCERSPAGTVPDRANAVNANAVNANVADDTTAGCDTLEDCDSYLSCIEGTCVEPGAVTGQHDSKTPVVSFVDDGGQTVASFFVELAVSAAEHEKGLMYRRTMNEDWGMIFIYPGEAVRSFWMQNTFISLDMIFIDGHGRIVNIIDEVEPLTRTRRTSTGAARYVLELNAGRAHEVGLAPGQRMQLEHIDQEHTPKP